MKWVIGVGWIIGPLALGIHLFASVVIFLGVCCTCIYVEHTTRLDALTKRNRHGR